MRAMASSAIVTCSPVEPMTSSSRGSGASRTSAASAWRRLVSPAIAEGTTTSWCPAARHFATRRATLRIRSTEPTDVPPNFWTMSDISNHKEKPRILQRHQPCNMTPHPMAQPSTERRTGPRARLRVVHRHRIGTHRLSRVSELVYVRGQPKVVLEWVDLAGVRAPLYLALD